MQRLPIFVVILLLNACTHSKQKENLTEAVFNEAIENSTQILLQENKFIYSSFEEELNDPRTKERAAIWSPYVLRIKQLSDSTIDRLHTIAKQININDEKLWNYSAFLPGIHNDLVNCLSSLLNINEEITKEFNHSIALYGLSIDSLSSNYKAFEKIFLSANTNKAFIYLLNAYENNIRKIENSMIDFCHHKIGYITEYVGGYQFLISQDKSIVSVNDSLEIKAGMGAFVTVNKPEVFIFGKKVPNNEFGFACYTFGSGKTKGKYNVPVTIAYIDPSTGETKTISQTITYTVR